MMAKAKAKRKLTNSLKEKEQGEVPIAFSPPLSRVPSSMNDQNKDGIRERDGDGDERRFSWASVNDDPWVEVRKQRIIILIPAPLPTAEKPHANNGRETIKHYWKRGRKDKTLTKAILSDVASKQNTLSNQHPVEVDAKESKPSGKQFGITFFRDPSKRSRLKGNFRPLPTAETEEEEEGGREMASNIGESSRCVLLSTLQSRGLGNNNSTKDLSNLETERVSDEKGMAPENSPSREERINHCNKNRGDNLRGKAAPLDEDIDDPSPVKDRAQEKPLSKEENAIISLDGSVVEKTNKEAGFEDKSQDINHTRIKSFEEKLPRREASTSNEDQTNPCKFDDEELRAKREMETKPSISLNLSINGAIRAENLKKQLEREGGLSKWLVSIGLGQFVKLFERHNFGELELSQLTMNDLKGMGAFAVGPRRKLIHAIECLCQRLIC